MYFSPPDCAKLSRNKSVCGLLLCRRWLVYKLPPENKNNNKFNVADQSSFLTTGPPYIISPCINQLFNLEIFLQIESITIYCLIYTYSTFNFAPLCEGYSQENDRNSQHQIQIISEVDVDRSHYLCWRHGPDLIYSEPGLKLCRDLGLGQPQY